MARPKQQEAFPGMDAHEGPPMTDEQRKVLDDKVASYEDWKGRRISAGEKEAEKKKELISCMTELGFKADQLYRHNGLEAVLEKKDPTLTVKTSVSVTEERVAKERGKRQEQAVGEGVMKPAPSAPVEVVEPEPASASKASGKALPKSEANRPLETGRAKMAAVAAAKPS